MLTQLFNVLRECSWDKLLHGLGHRIRMRMHRPYFQCGRARQEVPKGMFCVGVKCNITPITKSDNSAVDSLRAILDG